MNNGNWYSAEDWYAPLKAEGARTGTKKKKKKSLKAWHILGLLGLLILLIVASSMIFAGSGKSAPQLNPGGGAGELLPDDWKKAFENYYTSVESDVAAIDIPRAGLEPDFSLALQRAELEELSLQELYERCSDSIVAITGYVDGVSGYYWGSGVILSEDGLILTNAHVLEGCDSATVTLFDDRSFEAELVGADAISDIAVLKIDAAQLPVAQFGESGALAVGDHVAAIGNPLGQTFRSTLTDGIISAIERGISHKGHSMTLLQTNTALNDGNSGGALFNMYGQVVGITNMKMVSNSSSIEGIGFAIPSETVREVVNSLVKYGEVRGRPSIGITVGQVPQNLAEHYELPEGLYVSAVTKGSDAAEQGIRVGDIITEIDHSPVRTTDDVNKLKNALQVGDSMLFTVWRDGETLEISVKLMELNDIYG